MRRDARWSLLLTAVGLTTVAARAPGVAASARPEGARVASAAPVRIAGVAWEDSFARARARAAREGKPVLLLQLLGRLDQEFC